MKKININSARILKSRLESKLYWLVNKQKEVADYINASIVLRQLKM